MAEYRPYGLAPDENRSSVFSFPLEKGVPTRRVDAQARVEGREPLFSVGVTRHLPRETLRS